MRLARCAGVGYVVELRKDSGHYEGDGWFEVWVLKSQGQIINDIIYLTKDENKARKAFDEECTSLRRQNEHTTR